MDIFRKAGRRLKEFDDAYSAKIVDMYMGPEDNPRTYTDNPVLGTAAGLGAVFGGGTPVTDNNAAAYTGAVAKYVMPAVGVTLAGKALVDLSVLIGQQTSGTIEP